MKKTVFLALAGIAASAAAAQKSAPPDPLDSGAKVPSIQYRSTFETYRPYTDPPVGKWSEANEEVRALGGHAGHAVKPAASGAPASAPQAKDSGPDKAGKPSGHEGHHR